MKPVRMKLDYNHLITTIGEVMSNSRSKIARENGFGIAIGLDMLTNYIRLIARRAIVLQDEELLSLLQDMMVIKETDHKTEKGGGNNA